MSTGQAKMSIYPSPPDGVPAFISPTAAGTAVAIIADEFQ
jgi:hypothetical protein